MKKLKLFLLVLPILQANITAQSWVFVGLDSMVIKQLYVCNDSIYAGTAVRNGANINSGLYFSSDGGIDWVQLDSALGTGSIVGLEYRGEGKIFLIKGLSEGSLAGKLYKTTNGGGGWKVVTGLEGISIKWFVISPFNKDEMYALDNGYVKFLYRSTDRGENWQQIGLFPASSHSNKVTVTLDQVNESTLYAAVDDGIGGEYFFVSTNKGDSWNYVSEPPGVPSELYSDNEISGRIYMSAWYISEDGGVTWELTNSGLPDTSYYRSFYESPNNNEIYTLRSDGLYKSVKENIYWNRIEGSENLALYFGNGGFSDPDIGTLRNVIIDTIKSLLYVGTAKGIYKTDLITKVNNDNNNILTYSLSQNYPNPFNPSTKIEYTIAPPNLPEGEASLGTSLMKFVKLKIYDILGNEVAKLVDEEQTAGNYEVEFNGTGLTSGVYFYVLTATTENGESSSKGKKMILLK